MSLESLMKGVYHLDPGNYKSNNSLEFHGIKTLLEITKTEIDTPDDILQDRILQTHLFSSLNYKPLWRYLCMDKPEIFDNHIASIKSEDDYQKLKMKKIEFIEYLEEIFNLKSNEAFNLEYLSDAAQNYDKYYTHTLVFVGLITLVNSYKYEKEDSEIYDQSW